MLKVVHGPADARAQRVIRGRVKDQPQTGKGLPGSAMDRLAEGFLWYFAFLFSIVVHEAAHALAALRLGDKTAYHGGQVTLNPIPHIRRETFGTVIVPIFSYITGGWMIGWASTPYDNSWAERYHRRSALMALAGPLSNLAILLVSGLIIRLGVSTGLFLAPARLSFTHVTTTGDTGALEVFAVLLSILFSLNLILLLFNLLPIPPLDGSGAVTLLLDEDTAARYRRFTRHPAVALGGLILAWNFFGRFFGPLLLAAVNLLYPTASYY
jgi:Zn-dependent protease